MFKIYIGQNCLNLEFFPIYLIQYYIFNINYKFFNFKLVLLIKIINFY